MQQRFCECGCMIMVQYVLSEMMCRTVFLPGTEPGGPSLRVCPCCGRRLHIDSLG